MQICSKAKQQIKNLAMDDDNRRPIRRRKSSATWTYLNPEERSFLSASQLNAQNQKIIKGLEVVSEN